MGWGDSHAEQAWALTLAGAGMSRGRLWGCTPLNPVWQLRGAPVGAWGGKSPCVVHHGGCILLDHDYPNECEVTDLVLAIYCKH